MKPLSTLFAVTMLFSGCAVFEGSRPPAPSDIAVPDFKTYIFEKSVPEEFSADARSKLSISDKHYREKAKGSLRWDWDAPGATITFKHPEAFKHLTGENPDPHRLRLRHLHHAQRLLAVGLQRVTIGGAALLRDRRR